MRDGAHGRDCLEDQPVSRRAESTTLSPFLFALGQGVYAEEVRAVAGQLAYAQARSPEHLAGLGSGEAGWGTASSPETHAISIAGTTATVYEFRVWVDPDLQELRFAARADVPASTTCTVKLDVAGEIATLTFVGATTPTTVATADLATADTGTGLLDCSITVERTAGSGVGELLAWSVLGLHIADGDLPTLPDE